MAQPTKTKPANDAPTPGGLKPIPDDCDASKTSDEEWSDGDNVPNLHVLSDKDCVKITRYIHSCIVYMN